MKRFLHSIALLFSMVFVAFLLFVQSGKVFSQPVFPVPDHIVVVNILKITAYSQIIGSAAAPLYQSLANDTSSALFIQSYGIEHPANRIILIFIPAATRE